MVILQLGDGPLDLGELFELLFVLGDQEGGVPPGDVVEETLLEHQVVGVLANCFLPFQSIHIATRFFSRLTLQKGRNQVRH